MFKLRNWLSVLAGAAVIFAFALPTQAADVYYPATEQSQQVYVPSDALTRNAYAFGPQVTVQANVQKDLTAAGGVIEIYGNVADDALVAGGNIDISGNVGGSARVAGGNIRINSKTITEDLVVAGGTLYIGPDTNIKGDLLVAGGSVVLNGAVQGNVKIAGGSILMNGPVSGNVVVKAGNALQLGPQANIKGNLDYSGKYQLIRDPSAKVSGKISFTQLREGRFPVVGFLTVAFLLKLLAELIFAVLAFAVFRRKYENYMEKFRTGNYWKNLGIGLLTLIVVPVLALILCFTFIGYYVAMFAMAIYIAMLMLAWILGASFFGVWLMEKLTRGHFKINYANIIIGIIVAGFLRAIPVLGWIFAFVLVLGGLGIITSSINAERKR